MHLWSIVARENFAGEVIGRSQRLTVRQALRQLTLDGAAVLGREREVGSLKPGKLADLAVLSDDPLSIPVADLPKIRVRLTIVGGEVVHREDPPRGI